MGNGSSIPTCQKCESHLRKCLAFADVFFGCEKIGHKMRDFPLQITKRKYGKEAHPSDSDMCALRQNKVYAL